MTQKILAMANHILSQHVSEWFWVWPENDQSLAANLCRCRRQMWRGLGSWASTLCEICCGRTLWVRCSGPDAGGCSRSLRKWSAATCFQKVFHEVPRLNNSRECWLLSHLCSKKSLLFDLRRRLLHLLSSSPIRRLCAIPGRGAPPWLWHLETQHLRNTIDSINSWDLIMSPYAQNIVEELSTIMDAVRMFLGSCLMCYSW